MESPDEEAFRFYRSHLLQERVPPLQVNRPFELKKLLVTSRNHKENINGLTNASTATICSAEDVGVRAVVQQKIAVVKEIHWTPNARLVSARVIMSVGSTHAIVAKTFFVQIANHASSAANVVFGFASRTVEISVPAAFAMENSANIARSNGYSAIIVQA